MPKGNKTWTRRTETVLDGPYSLAEAERFKLSIEGHQLPYIDVVDVTAQWMANPPADPEQWADEAFRLIKAAQERGERIFNITVDRRFSLTATESEIERWTWFLAHAMAISAGYTSHGPSSRRLNRHGVSSA